MRIISVRELHEFHAKLDASDHLFQTLAVISNWPDYRFTTSDGREYGLFDDGESIEHRLDAKSEGLTPNERERLQKIAGFILELGDESNEPMIFADTDSLAGAWLALHQSHGIKLSDEEQGWYE